MAHRPAPAVSAELSRVLAAIRSNDARFWADEDVPPGETVPPSDEELWGLAPNPDSDPPDGADAWMADVPADVLHEYLNVTGEPAGRGTLRAGLWPRDRGDGAGFGAGGVADRIVPGVALAGLARDAWTDGLSLVSDDELIGVLLAWRRLTSWATAGELAAVAELNRRRTAQVAAGADPHLAEHVGDEVAVPLTLTTRAADGLLDFACALARLPRTRAALAAGDIDRAKAHVIADEVGCLDGPHAAAVEAAVINRAARQTTGQLRAATRRAVLAADPAAARKRREEARKDARVEVWDERAGTAALAGRDLPPADVLAADKRIDGLARQLKAADAGATLDQLRAKVYTALLLDQPIEGLFPTQPPAGPAASTPAAADRPPASSATADAASRTLAPNARAWAANAQAGVDGGGTVPPGFTRNVPGPGPAKSGGPGTGTAQPVQEPLSQAHLGQAPPGQAHPVRAYPGQAYPGDPCSATGSVNLTLPLATWLGAAELPGEVAGFGPIPAGDAQALAHLLSTQPGSRWCVTLTGRDGCAVAHGCAQLHRDADARGSPGKGPGGRGGTGGDPAPTPAAGNAAGPGASRSPVDGAGWALTVTVRPLAVGDCAHDREPAGYRPSPSLRHLLNIRHRTCSFPGCRRPATRCDHDHTIPYGKGGRTCECGMEPLCRRHHRAKQAQGWHLDQPEPGVLVWRLPHGRTYRVDPAPYPD